MTSLGDAHSWLPDHQLHVAVTLAHVDDLIGRATDIYFDYIAPPGPLGFENVFEERVSNTKVRFVAPLPAAIGRYAADALTQLRAAIEHTIFAEVEFLLGRTLTSDEGRQIEMPATTEEPKFGTWLSKGPRRELAPLQVGSQLVQRIRDLQPYQRQDVDQHPLRILAEHTNHAKHRAPALAATGVGAVIPAGRAPEVDLADSRTGGPVRVGDILATAPLGVVVPVDIWPTISIRRPHTDTWHVLIKELGALEEWVRTVAIPMLVTGRHDVRPLPPELDTTVGHDNPRAALAGAGQVPAVQRLRARLNAGVGRVSLVEVLELYPGGQGRDILQPWVDELTDDEVLERVDRVTRHRHDVDRMMAAVRELQAEAHRHAMRRRVADGSTADTV